MLAIQLVPLLWLAFFCAVVSGGGRLVLHVGPHKTGTTSTQAFLIEHSEWLLNSFGIHVAAGHRLSRVGAIMRQKLGAFVPNTLIARQDARAHDDGLKLESAANVRLVSEKHYIAVTSEIARWCGENATVLMSSEDFSGLHGSAWFSLTQLCSDITLVMAHRDEAAWARSTWGFHENMKKPRSFGAFLVDEGPRRWAQGTELLDELERVAGGASNVVGVSFELLVQENTSMPSFLVCNATLRFSGQPYSDCQRAFRNFKVLNENPSLNNQEIILEVHRLARAAWLLKAPCSAMHSSSAPEEMPRIDEKLAASIGAALPKTCATTTGSSASLLTAMARASGVEWYRRTGARQPRDTPSKAICVVDEGAMTRDHWKLISGLLREC